MSHNFLKLREVTEGGNMVKPVIINIPSKFHRARTREVDLLVVHAMGEWIIDDMGVFHHCTDWLNFLKISVHTFCLPDGRIIKSVDTRRLAHHAKRFNGRSAGMEFLVEGGQNLASLEEHMDDAENPPYTEAQYESGGWWFKQRAKEHGITFDQIKTHTEIDPDRKKDPGRAFDWEAFKSAFEAAD